MAVALQRHHLLNLLGTKGHYASHVVAGQIDQHHVLGQLLGVLGQLGGHAPVVGLGSSSASGPSDRTGDHPPVQQLHHGLWGGPDHRKVLVAEEVHVRAGVDLPEHPVDVERLSVQLHVEPL